MTAEYHRNYYAKRSPEAKARKQALQKERAQKNIIALREYKAEVGCLVCGEKDPIVLDFDHREQSEKSLTFGNACRLGYSLAKLMAEAEKCDVLCANCHRRRTAKQLGWHV